MYKTQYTASIVIPEELADYRDKKEIRLEMLKMLSRILAEKDVFPVSIDIHFERKDTRIQLLNKTTTETVHILKATIYTDDILDGKSVLVIHEQVEALNRLAVFGWNITSTYQEPKRLCYICHTETPILTGGVSFCPKHLLLVIDHIDWTEIGHAIEIVNRKYQNGHQPH